MKEKREEFVPNDRVMWQSSDSMHVYKCPRCEQPVFTQYEGEATAVNIDCLPDGHKVVWK